jgi:hypothetical protein
LLSYGRTVVVWVAVLLLVFWSVVVAVTLTVFEMVPFTLGFTTIVTVSVLPFDRVPKLHVTSCFLGFRVHVPDVAVADPKPAFLGKLSVRVTPVAESGPVVDHGDRVGQRVPHVHRVATAPDRACSS